MRVIIQRVKKAYVSINGEIYSDIEQGLLILAGFEDSDTSEDLEWMAGKISRLRIFDDKAGVMNLSVNEIGGEILVVSQFTLFASTKKGNRPSYIRASKPETSIPLYESFVRKLQETVSTKVKTGVFGAMMDVGLINDGPVTISIDSANKE